MVSFKEADFKVLRMAIYSKYILRKKKNGDCNVRKIHSYSSCSLIFFVVQGQINVRWKQSCVKENLKIFNLIQIACCVLNDDVSNMLATSI